MPLRSDPSLWYNLPGVVAAYQPVMAPSSLLARYNQAHGGDNRYRAEPGVLPTWASKTGWTFDGATQYLNTMYYPASSGDSLVFRVMGSGAGFYGVCGRVDLQFPIQRLYAYAGSSSKRGWGTGTSAETALSPNVANGVMAIAGLNRFLNGVADGTGTGAWTARTLMSITIGALNAVSPVSLSYGSGSILAVAMYARTLSPAEVWLASRQMAYCDVNPDWSAWGRRRRWYYAPQVAGFQAAWAAHTNRLIGGGN